MTNKSEIERKIKADSLSERHIREGIYYTRLNLENGTRYHVFFGSKAKSVKGIIKSIRYKVMRKYDYDYTLNIYYIKRDAYKRAFKSNNPTEKLLNCGIKIL